MTYDFKNGKFDDGKEHPSSMTYGEIKKVDHPSKKVTIIGNKNSTSGSYGTNVTITNEKKTYDIDFAWWTASGLNTSTAKTGQTIDDTTHSWPSEDSHISNSLYFKNLRSSSGTFKFIAHWKSKTVTLPKVERSGYTCGWSTSSKGTSIDYSSQGSYTITQDSATTVNLYAVCTTKSFTVAYNKGSKCYTDANITGSVGSHTCAYDAACSLKNNEFSVNGCTFTGWKKSNSGNLLQPGTSIRNVVESGTVTYYAQWNENTCTLKFSPNGGTFNKNASDTSTSFLYSHANFTTIRKAVGSGSKYEATRDGYHAKSGAEWINATSGTTYNQAGGNWSVSKFCPDIADGDQTVTLKVNWEPNSITVNYNGNGATGGSTASHTCNYNGDCTLKNNGFTRKGYTFVGWKKDDTGTTYGEGREFTMKATSGTVTYYAQWKANTLSIKYNSNGGILDTLDSLNWYLNKYDNLVRDGSTIFKTSSYGKENIDLDNYNNSSWVNFVKTGYVAVSKKEWYAINNGTKTYFDQSVSNIKAVDLASANGCNLENGDCAVTLYVNWEAVKPTITFSHAGTYYEPVTVTITCSSEAGVKSFSTSDDTGDRGNLVSNDVTTKSRQISLTSVRTNGWIYAMCESNNGAITEATRSYTISYSTGSYTDAGEIDGVSGAQSATPGASGGGCRYSAYGRGC